VCRRLLDAGGARGEACGSSGGTLLRRTARGGGRLSWRTALMQRLFPGASPMRSKLQRCCKRALTCSRRPAPATRTECCS
jgi:hypothetical protein